MYYTLNIAIPYIYIYFEIQTRKKKKKKTLTKPVLNFSALCVRARYRSQLLKLLNVCVNWWLVLSASLHDSLSVSPSFTSRYTTRYISMRCECVCAQFIRSDFGCLCLQPQYRSALAWTNKIYRKMVIFISGNRRCAWTLSNRHNDQSTICEQHRTVGCDYIALSPQHQPSYRNNTFMCIIRVYYLLIIAHQCAQECNAINVQSPCPEPYVMCSLNSQTMEKYSYF